MTLQTPADDPQLRVTHPAGPIPASAYDVELADTFADPVWRDAALAVISTFGEAGEPFTVDDVRPIVGDPPGSRNAWGGVFRAARRDGIIRKTGRVLPSATASRHGSLVTEWIGAAA